MHCPTCDTDRPVTAKFCDQCGAELLAEKISPARAAAENIYDAYQSLLFREGDNRTWCIANIEGIIELEIAKAPAAPAIHWRPIAELDLPCDEWVLLLKPATAMSYDECWLMAALHEKPRALLSGFTHFVRAADIPMPPHKP